MISISLDTNGLHRALNEFGTRLDGHLAKGLEATLESIAARAKQTTTFVDRTGTLRNSIQSEGVTGSFWSDRMVGTIGFGATAGQAANAAGRNLRKGRGHFYGLDQEYGTRTIHEKRFVRDAIDAEFGGFLEDSIANAFREAGFEVSG